LLAFIRFVGFKQPYLSEIERSYKQKQRQRPRIPLGGQYMGGFVSMFEKIGECNSTEITDLGALKKISTCPGVYFMSYIENHEPKPFPRLNGKTDDEGILCIGKAKNLRRRIQQFRRDVLDTSPFRNCHSEGWNYRKYFRDNDYPDTIKLDVKNVWVTWTELDNEKDADKLETECIQHYIMQYQDKPPLNISIKRQRERRPKK